VTAPVRVMSGSSSGEIEDTCGKARRVWVMDRGVPSEAILKDMRDPEQQTFYLAGTPQKARSNRHEMKRSGWIRRGNRRATQWR
jgi:hypothetical protein